MSRKTSKLSAFSVQHLKSPGKYSDGGNLYLQVSPHGTKSWIFRYKFMGRSREMGLGSVTLLTLSEARNRAFENRKLLLSGIDPIGKKKADVQESIQTASRRVTFDYCASSYIESHKSTWKNAKHMQQWQNTIKQYASPVVGRLAVQDIDQSHVLQILTPIWKTMPESASRLRGRIERVLDWARARGYRNGENPARWRGHLQVLLPSHMQIKKIKHHKALPLNEISHFVKELQQQPGIAAKALELLILTATRTSEVLGARWEEINFENRIWTIPEERMKAGIEHQIPLCDRAIEILSSLSHSTENPFIFPGEKQGRSLSNMALLMIIRRMGADCVSHGFRSAFRDFAGERTNFSREVAEASLAHRLKDKVERSYFRSNLLDKRRKLMNAWAIFCETEVSDSKVLTFRSDAL